MHYRNGREAKNGDKVVQLQMGGGAVITAVGVLYDATPGNDFCNGRIAPTQQPVEGACLCDCLHVDDVAAYLTEHGMNLRPCKGQPYLPPAMVVITHDPSYNGVSAVSGGGPELPPPASTPAKDEMEAEERRKHMARSEAMSDNH